MTRPNHGARPLPGVARAWGAKRGMRRPLAACRYRLFRLRPSGLAVVLFSSKPRGGLSQAPHGLAVEGAHPAFAEQRRSRLSFRGSRLTRQSGLPRSTLAHERTSLVSPSGAPAYLRRASLPAVSPGYRAAGEPPRQLPRWLVEYSRPRGSRVSRARRSPTANAPADSTGPLSRPSPYDFPKLGVLRQARLRGASRRGRPYPGAGDFRPRTYRLELSSEAGIVPRLPGPQVLEHLGPLGPHGPAAQVDAEHDAGRSPTRRDTPGSFRDLSSPPARSVASPYSFAWARLRLRGNHGGDFHPFAHGRTGGG